MVELFWDGKYEGNKRDGKRVAPVRIALPFQDVETVNESVVDRQRSFDLFSTGQPSEWRNRLIWGDKKYVLPSLLPEFAGKVKLIYIDPPFATGDNFSFSVEVEGEDFTKEPSAIERKAYRDIWGGDPDDIVKSVDSYVKWFYETAVLLYELLNYDGGLYVHCDGRVNSYVRCVLDEVFGPDYYRNEISWKRTNAHGNADYKFGAVTDFIFFYAKSADTKLNPSFQSYSESEVTDVFQFVEEGTGRRYASQNMTNYNKDRPNLTYEWNGHRRTWLFTIEKMRELDAQGKIIYSSTGYPRMKQYAYESAGRPIGDLWMDINALKHAGNEVLGYPTQKPEALLERIIKASSNEGDLILDCFSGSGTTAAVAERLGRRWITADFGRFAIHTTRKRLLGIANVRPFVVQNLGKYERQVWQEAEFGDSAAMRQQTYISFILKLYGATEWKGLSYIQGIKSGRAVYVGAVDSPITSDDVAQTIEEWKRNVGERASGKERLTSGIDFLGWEFTFELNERVKQEAAANDVDVRFYDIPREVMEKKAVDQNDIQFFERAALDVSAAVNGYDLSITLNNFIMPPASVPKDIREHVGSKWYAWIDYWAVDWDFKGDTFHNQWQDYRTRKKTDILRRAVHHYDSPGRYEVMIKVIDILGNDTTKLINVEVK